MAVSQPINHAIGTLYKHNPTVNVAVEGQLYEVPWGTGDDTVFILVLFPTLFPDEAPVITVSPSGTRHPWIHTDTLVHDAIVQWTPTSNLGLIVKEIRDEFTRHPPVKKTTEIHMTSQRAQDSHYSHRPPPALPTPSPSTAALALLTSSESMAVMTTSPAQVQELLSSDYCFEQFFHSLERVQNLKTVQEELRNGNESVAYKNLSRQEELVQLRQQVETLNTEYKQLKTEYDTKERQQQEAFSRFSASTVLTRLKAGVYESDELSESVAQSFLEGNLHHDSFVKQFRELRKVYHLRASKLERAQKDGLFNQ